MKAVEMSNENPTLYSDFYYYRLYTHIENGLVNMKWPVILNFKTLALKLVSSYYL